MKLRCLVFAGLVAGSSVLLWAAPAGAEVNGACRATVAGQDVGSRSSSSTGDAIAVKSDQVVVVGATSSTPITGYRVKMSFAGFEWQVASGKADGNSWQKTVNVKDYARFGVGLYKVKGESLGDSPCTGAVLIKITGKSPLTTVAGGASAVLLLGSVIGGATGLFGAASGGQTVSAARLATVNATNPETAVECMLSQPSPATYVQTMEALSTNGASWPVVNDICARPVVALACGG